MKRILILGATGSVGQSACDVIRAHPDDFCVAALAARSNRVKAEALGREFGAPVFCGEDAACQAVESVEADLALVCTVGLSGLLPTLAAFRKGMDVALATKEVMVAAGAFVAAQARAAGVHLIPVDSEHSAIFQCLQSRGAQEIERLTLTASGGPFLDGPADLSVVTPAQARHHPRWKMGTKVTIDSATMMNKGFEILEASSLFGISSNRIHVVVHPESVVHSLVSFTDGATLAQLAPPDMRVPIQYAFSWPNRLSATHLALDLEALGALTFRAPDETRFPSLRIVREAAALGGVHTAALSAADEVAVTRFLSGEIRFTDIPRLVEAAVHASPDLPCDSVQNILAADAAARKFALTWNS